MRSRRVRVRRAIALALAGAVATSVVAGVAVAEDPSPELRWRFRAQRQLERMGIRHVVATDRTVNERGGQRAPEYRGRVTAPTLAFLNGLSDLEGGLPSYRAVVYFVVRQDGAVELRADAVGRVTDLVGTRTDLKVYDPSRLPERVRLAD